MADLPARLFLLGSVALLAAISWRQEKKKIQRSDLPPAWRITEHFDHRQAEKLSAAKRRFQSTSKQLRISVGSATLGFEDG